MRTPHGLPRALSRAFLPFGVALLAGAAAPAAAQVVPLDLLNRLAALETGARTAGTTLSGLQSQTASNTGRLGTQGEALSALGAQVGGLAGQAAAAATKVDAHAQALTALDADLGSMRATVSALDTGLATASGRLDTTAAKVADIEVQLGGLRGLLGNLDVPDVIDVTGPVNVSEIVGTLNRQVVATATANVAIGTIRANDAKQDDRLAEHETRITRNTADLAAHGLELADHERRIAGNTADIRANESAIADLQSRMTNGFADIAGELGSQSRRIDKATEGVAMALAMKSPAVPDDKNFALSGSFGAFDGQTALAFAGGVRASEALQFDAGVAVGLDRGSVGGRAGATLAW